MRHVIERHRYLLDFTLSSISRRKGKSLALLAVYAAVVFALASVLFFTEALRREARVVLRDAPELLVQQVVERLRSLAGSEVVLRSLPKVNEGVAFQIPPELR